MHLLLFLCLCDDRTNIVSQNVGLKVSTAALSVMDTGSGVSHEITMRYQISTSCCKKTTADMEVETDSSFGQ